MLNLKGLVSKGETKMDIEDLQKEVNLDKRESDAVNIIPATPLSMAPDVRELKTNLGSPGHPNQGLYIH